MQAFSHELTTARRSAILIAIVSIRGAEPDKNNGTRAAKGGYYHYYNHYNFAKYSRDADESMGGLTDIHAHVLPGVDDGAKDQAASRALLREAARLGITELVATPHAGLKSDMDKRAAAFAAMEPFARSLGIHMRLGCEARYEILAQPERLARYAIAGTRAILLELPALSLMPNWESILPGAAEDGFHLILAHVERCAYVQKDLAIVEEFRSMGCALQIDASGLFAPLFSPERRAARKLLAAGMVDYIASDAHGLKDYALYEAARKKFSAQWPRDDDLRRWE